MSAERVQKRCLASSALDDEAEGQHQTNAHMRLILEQIPAVLWTLDRELRFTSSLGAGLKALGLSPNKVVGMSLFEYLQTSDPNNTSIAAHLRVLRGESVSYAESWNENEYQCHLEPLRDAAGGIIGCIGIALDVTDRKRAEESLRQSEQRFRVLVQNSPDMIMRLDCDGNIQFINHTLPGYDVDSVLGTNALDYLAPTDVPRYVEALHDVFTMAESRSLEVLAEGGTCWMVRLTPVLHRSDVSTCIVIATDMTERKRLEEFAARAQRLETAGRIAGQVAHDFNNLLGPLMAYPELLRDCLEPGSRALKYINDMEQAASQMAEINQQLLTLGRRGHYNQEPMNLNQTIDAVINQLRPLPETLVLKQDLAPDLMHIKGGGAQLFRAILNLISNARDAMQDVGRLTITTENAYIDDTEGVTGRVPRGEYVKLTIADTGCGMSAETFSKTFDPFFTTKTADRERGSGLGLSVVHAVVEDHNGHIDCHSATGEGTTFFLYFPITRDAVEAASGSRIVGGSERIMVVDDDQLQLKVARTLLESLGYIVTDAPSGERALEILAEQTCDLMIVDMIMPHGIDGAETCRRAFAYNDSQRVILLSGYAESDRVQEALRIGAGAFVRKPLTLKSISLAVRKELDRERARAVIT